MSFTEKEIEEKFKVIAAKVTQKPMTIIDLKSSFADLSIDSVQAMEIIGCLEDEFDIEFQDSQLVKIKTIDALINLIHQKVQ